MMGQRNLELVSYACINQVCEKAVFPLAEDGDDGQNSSLYLVELLCLPLT
jgi:hypothetical protein